VLAWVGDVPEVVGAERRDAVPYLGVGPTAATAAPGELPDEPQAFAVLMGREAEVLRVHYHPVDQFQYFAVGGGKFGGHAVGRGVVHYTDALTPYGPLLPGEDGVGFLTLRTTADSGAFYMPESQPHLSGERSTAGPEPHRSLTVDLEEAGRADAWTDLVADADGLAVRYVDAGPGAPIAVPAVEGAGAYLLVVRGAIDPDADAGGARAASVTFVAPGIQPEPVTAGPDGARLAVLQYPERPAAALTP
jgi:hypothetical protein